MSNSDPSAFFYLTAEIRWFKSGRIPQEVRNWFGNGDFPLTPSTRTDRYLVYPTSAHVGVKFREERFEVKALVGEPDLFEVGDHITGKIERWEKLSAGAASVSGLFRDLSETVDRWTDVTKTRWMRLFKSEGDRIMEIDPGPLRQHPDQGCYAEITDLDIEGIPCWTLGLESFGSEASLERTLTRTTQFLFHGEMKQLQLSETDSCAYPGFLRKFRLKSSAG